MHKKLETYLEEIGHFLSGREEREEILADIRGIILEKAGGGSGPVDEAELEKAIAAYGAPRRVAEKYLDGRPVIAPAFQRHLFRYATLLFAVHLVFIVGALVFKQSFMVFPFLFVPRLGLFEAVMYLPMAFLADFGAAALALYLLTRSGKEIKLPWPKFAVDLDEVKPAAAKTLAVRIATLVGAGIMLALTALGVHLYAKFSTVFLIGLNSEKFRPLLLPRPGRMISLAILVMMAAGTIGLFIKAFNASRRLACWIDLIADGSALVLIGLALRQPFASLFAIHLPPRSLAWLHITLTVSLLFIALMVAIDLVANAVRLGRKRLVR
jgi:hypothetical protein